MISTWRMFEHRIFRKETKNPWVKLCHVNHPIFDGNHTTYKHGDDWGMVCYCLNQNTWNINSNTSILRANKSRKSLRFGMLLWQQAAANQSSSIFQHHGSHMGYKWWNSCLFWDYTFCKWGFVSINLITGISGHNCFWMLKHEKNTQSQSNDWISNKLSTQNQHSDAFYCVSCRWI